ncbi:MAG: glycine zipper 2TM domain-containing protein [Sphingomonadaceae bacterium]|nr:glycine zipper 2TM domain-containing protein [Sphingomonadaceae bacterium]
MRIVKLAALAATATLALAAPAFAQSRQDDARFAAAQDRFDRELSTFRAEYDRYMSLRGNRDGYRDQGYNDNRGDSRGYADDRYDPNYDATRYYRDGPNYQERVLAADDRVYRGSDGRYYCRRNDGTTGLIVGAVGGGILGNVIDGGHSRAAGTLLGAGIGALAGRAIDQNSNSNSVRCR